MESLVTLPERPGGAGGIAPGMYRYEAGDRMAVTHSPTGTCAVEGSYLGRHLHMMAQHPCWMAGVTEILSPMGPEWVRDGNGPRRHG